MPFLILCTSRSDHKGRIIGSGLVLRVEVRVGESTRDAQTRCYLTFIIAEIIYLITIGRDYGVF